MGRNHLRVLGGLAGVRLVAVADPEPRRPGRGQPRGPAPRRSASRWPCCPRPIWTRSSSRRRPPATCRWPSPAIERGIAVLVEKPLAATPAEADRIVAAASARRRAAGPGRPHRAVQSGRPRARAAARGGLAVDGLRHHEPSRRSVPGAHPRRRRDRRPRDARRRHPVRDRRRSARRASRPRRPGASTPTTRTCCSA